MPWSCQIVACVASMSYLGDERKDGKRCEWSRFDQGMLGFNLIDLIESINWSLFCFFLFFCQHIF